LVVDFDTTVNSSPTDISGKGNHGILDGATYSAPDKAFNFDGSNDEILVSSISGATDNYVHSVSTWVKFTNTPAIDQIFMLGNDNNDNITSAVRVDGTSTFKWFFYNNDMEYTTYKTLLNNTWYHLVCSYTGGSTVSDKRLWLDGIELVGTSAGANFGAPLDLPTNAALRIGHRQNNANDLNGQISNFKLYSVALEPSEVKKLYNLGRTGRSMVISDTAVGIGKAPEAQLDVRGNLAVRGDIEAYGKNFNMSPAGNLSILGSIYGASVTAPYVRSYWNTYGFDGAWRTLIGTGVYDCGIGFLVHQTADDTAMFRFAHNGAGTKHVGWIYNSGYTSITYSGSNIKIQGPGGISRAYILYLNT
jgi:hypothetical protein